MAYKWSYKNENEVKCTFEKFSNNAMICPGKPALALTVLWILTAIETIDR